MGRDILHSTWLREQRLLEKQMNCEVDHIVRAHFVQTVQRTKPLLTASGNIDNTEGNKVGDIFTLRVCNKHHFTEWKDGMILKDEPIIKGVNNVHD